MPQASSTRLRIRPRLGVGNNVFLVGPGMVARFRWHKVRANRAHIGVKRSHKMTVPYLGVPCFRFGKQHGKLPRFVNRNAPNGPPHGALGLGLVSQARFGFLPVQWFHSGSLSFCQSSGFIRDPQTDPIDCRPLAPGMRLDLGRCRQAGPRLDLAESWARGPRF